MVRCDANFKREIEAKCIQALQREGFTQHRKNWVDWPLPSGFNCWVGLNTGLHPDRLNINPFVGVHVVPLERLKAKFAAKYDRSVATYAIHFGELDAAKREPIFSFRPEQSEQEITDEVRRLARLYATVGLDYAKSVGSYQKLRPLLEMRVEQLGGAPESLACCLLLTGEIDEAHRFASSMLSSEPEYFQVFGPAFLDALSRGGNVSEWKF